MVATNTSIIYNLKPEKFGGGESRKSSNINPSEMRISSTATTKSFFKHEQHSLSPNKLSKTSVEDKKSDRSDENFPIKQQIGRTPDLIHKLESSEMEKGPEQAMSLKEKPPKPSKTKEHPE